MDAQRGRQRENNDVVSVRRGTQERVEPVRIEGCAFQPETQQLHGPVRKRTQFA